MTDKLFERLLFEEEGTTLDFKMEQYNFVGATEEQRYELVKDILGFANAWRRTKAYILIGVKEVRGGKSTVVGIPPSEQLDDHAIQQFIHSLVNAPVHLQYRVFSYRRKQVGIFVFDLQDRPIFLKRNYSKLAKGVVYVRRGSSTNPQVPATADEIARMGASRPTDRAELLVEFADDLDDAIGPQVHLQSEYCSVPQRKDIPKLREPNERTLGFVAALRSHNPNYYEELAAYELLTRLHQPVRLTVKNTGEVAANNVRIELIMPINSGLLPVEQLPARPEKVETSGASAMREIRGAHRHGPGDVHISENKERYRITIDCDHLQPGRQVWSETFYIGAGRSGNYSIPGRVLADNLPSPQQFT